MISSIGILVSSFKMSILERSSTFLRIPLSACCGGGFPLTVKNAGVIGTICVSGLPHLEDHKLIVDALEQYLGDR